MGGLATTAIENAGSDALACPSLTLITILPKVPIELLGAVPVRRPLDALKEAHAGSPVIENVRLSPLGPDAEGWNE